MKQSLYKCFFKLIHISSNFSSYSQRR